MAVAYLVVSLYAMVSRLVGARPLFTAVALDALSGSREVSHERAARELGYSPRPLHKTVEDSLHWFVESGTLSLVQPTASTGVA
jgi:dihydroflavonol-4-reductase